MFCRNCGKELKNGARFCGYCGAQVRESQTTQEHNQDYEKNPDNRKRSIEKLKVQSVINNNSKEKKTKHKKNIVIVIVIVVAVLLVALFLLNYFQIISLPFLSQSSSDETAQEDIYYKEIDEEHVAEEEDGVVRYIDNEILLVAEEGVTYEQIAELVESYDGEIVGYIEETGDYQVELESVQSMSELEDLAEQLSEESLIASADINYVNITATDTIRERDGYQYGSKWTSDLQNFNDCSGKSWGLEAINTLAAWDILSENHENPVRVGLVDAGFDENHEDLGFAEVFYNGKSTDTSEGNHGTHVAGTMAARSDNKEGICGVYPYGNGNLYAVNAGNSGVQSEDDYPTFFTSTMTMKVSYAELICRNVKVINCSLGFNYYKWNKSVYGENGLEYTDSRWVANEQAVTKQASVLGDFLNRLLVKGYDFVLVDSAGNDSRRDENVIYDSTYSSWMNAISQTEYPDVYNRIIVVGAVDSSFNITNFSNGGDRVDIYAPGVNIYSTVYNNQYSNDYTGTSMAAPHISGIAAMVWTVNNSLTGEQVKTIVCGDKSSYRNSRCTAANMADASISLEEAVKTLDAADVQAEEQDDTGVIMCWVVDDSSNDIKIANATVKATNTSTGEEESTTTDSEGHFELVLAEGSYTLTVEADGYESATISDITVENGQVNYLNKRIKMTSTKASKESSSLSVKQMEQQLENQFNPGYIIDYYPADYDGDGRTEVFGAYMNSEDDYDEYSMIYNNVSIVYNDTDGNIMQCSLDSWDGVVSTIYGYPTGVLNSGGKSFFVWEESGGGSASESHIFSVGNGKPQEESVHGMCAQQYDANTISVIDSEFNAFWEGTGHTYLPYYLYYDNGFKEYGAVEISVDQFRNFNNADTVLNDIANNDGTIETIYYRSNGMIHINFTNDYERANYCVTLLIDGNSVSYRTYDDGVDKTFENCLEYGIYASAMFPEIATYKEF